MRSARLDCTAGNKSIDQIIETVGHQKVQDGHIVTIDAVGVFGVAGMPRSAKQDYWDKVLRRGAT